MDALPPLADFGADLLQVPSWRRVLNLATPFAFAAAFFVFGARGWWLAALACTVALSFVTYGSISHDLVHRTLGLPRWLNEILLSAIELLAFRSGHAYRVTHLHHHAHFPAHDDLEGAAASMPLWRAALDGITLQPRLYRFALHKSHGRAWIIGEGIAIAAMLAASATSPATAAYAILMIAGSWIFPIVTAYAPHDASASSELTQTRLYRGTFLKILALDHFYHLEHHLYPQVPHQRWPELARRLDPFFARAGLRAITLWF
ncbi:MAG TPA: fatty acid desaturase [Thermoanaerobaculia bacterium]|nr:fatty acid desaturase [Thermoanaerobaculia bacterium]